MVAHGPKPPLIWLWRVARDGLVIFHDYVPDYPGIVTMEDRLIAP